MILYYMLDSDESYLDLNYSYLATNKELYMTMNM